MAKLSLFEKMLKSFEEGSELVLSEMELKHQARITDFIELRLKELTLTDYDFYLEMKPKYPHLTFPQAMMDINIAERVISIGRDKTGYPEKTWTRYLISQVTMKAIALAEKKGDGYTMAYAANILGKHKGTDREDIVKVPYDEIVPFIPEITTDPTVLGIKPIKDLEATKKRMLKKYGLEHAFEEAEIIKDEI